MLCTFSDHRTLSRTNNPPEAVEHDPFIPAGGDKKKDTVTEIVAGEPEIYKGVTARNTSYQDIDMYFSTLESYYTKGIVNLKCGDMR